MTDIHLEDNLEKTRLMPRAILTLRKSPNLTLRNSSFVLNHTLPCRSLTLITSCINNHIFCIKTHICWLFFTTGWMPLVSYPWEASHLEHHKTLKAIGKLYVIGLYIHVHIYIYTYIYTHNDTHTHIYIHTWYFVFSDTRYGQNSCILLSKESSLASGKCTKHCVVIGPLQKWYL